MVKWYDRIGNTIEMYVNDTWTKGTVINGERTGDGIINMETADGKKYWCGVCSGYYKKSEDSLGDLITQADRIRAMSDEELAEVIPVIFDCCCNPTVECMQYVAEHGECIKTTECVLKWLKSEVKE